MQDRFFEQKLILVLKETFMQEFVQKIYVM